MSQHLSWCQILAFQCLKITRGRSHLTEINWIQWAVLDILHCAAWHSKKHMQSVRSRSPPKAWLLREDRKALSAFSSRSWNKYGKILTILTVVAYKITFTIWGEEEEKIWKKTKAKHFVKLLSLWRNRNSAAYVTCYAWYKWMCLHQSISKTTARLDDTEEWQINLLLWLHSKLNGTEYCHYTPQKQVWGRGKSVLCNSGITQCCLRTVKVQQWIFARISYETGLCSWF